MNLLVLVFVLIVVLSVGLTLSYTQYHTNNKNDNKTKNDQHHNRITNREHRGDMSWIPLPGLPHHVAIGNVHAASDLYVLNEFDAVVVALPFLPLTRNMYPTKLQVIHIPIEDNETTNLFDWIPTVVNQVQPILAQNGKVLIHCWVGMSRSVSLASAVIMKWTGWSFDETLKHIQRYRPIANPIQHFQLQLRLNWS